MRLQAPDDASPADMYSEKEAAKIEEDAMADLTHRCVKEEEDGAEVHDGNEVHHKKRGTHRSKKKRNEEEGQMIIGGADRTEVSIRQAQDASRKSQKRPKARDSGSRKP